MNLNPLLFVFGKLKQKEVIINPHDQEKRVNIIADKLSKLFLQLIQLLQTILNVTYFSLDVPVE